MKLKFFVNMYCSCVIVLNANGKFGITFCVKSADYLLQQEFAVTFTLILFKNTKSIKIYALAGNNFLFVVTFIFYTKFANNSIALKKAENIYFAVFYFFGYFL